MSNALRSVAGQVASVTAAESWPGARIGQVEELPADGLIVVRVQCLRVVCECLEDRISPQRPLAVGDRVLVMMMSQPDMGVVLGRVGPHITPVAHAHLTLEATESLTLKCGEASVELRADGRAMVKGEDVLLRAKGTQRIRAGNVAIN